MVEFPENAAGFELAKLCYVEGNRMICTEISDHIISQMSPSYENFERSIVEKLRNTYQKDVLHKLALISYKWIHTII